MNHSENFDVLTALEAMLHWAGHGDLQRAADTAAQWPEHSKTLLNWLARATAQPMLANTPGCLSPTLAASLDGWHHYLDANYENAITAFRIALTQAAPIDMGTLTDAALGLAKIYTRTGHWETSRRWVLQALHHARHGNRTYDMVRCYGALGELLLRGNAPEAALFCLDTSYNLMPSGAGQRARQLNYLASALMRLPAPRDIQTAETLLMQSYYLALDQNDRSSAVHTLARLQFLEIQRGNNHDIVDKASYARLADLPREIPGGFLAQGRALAALLREEHETALYHTKTALGIFKCGQPEHLWAQSLARRLGETIDADLTFRPNVTVFLPQPAPVIVDRKWLEPALHDAPAHFDAPPPETTALLSHRQVFFL